MKKKQLFFVFVLSVIFSPHSLVAQLVWPGDINNNGKVTGVDLLYLGVAFDAVGAQRVEETTDWEGQPLPELWSENFPNGLNYAYADCDGNGIVEEDDFDKAIEENFGLTHDQVMPDGYVNGQPESSPKLRLTSTTNLAQPGDTVLIDLKLDDAGFSIQDFYGMALKISYSADLMEGDDEPDFDLMEDSWIEVDNSTVYDLFMEDNDNAGKAELAITRTNQIGVPVDTGIIGQISIVIQDIIVGLSEDTLRVEIDSVLVINSALEPIPVAPDQIEIIVTGRTKWPPVKNETLKINSDIYPNPSKGVIYVKPAVPTQQLQLLNEFGQSVPVFIQEEGDGTYQIMCNNQPPGVYYLMKQSGDKVSYEKIILL